MTEGSRRTKTDCRDDHKGTKMKIEMIQHAVGQGGFFTGSIKSDGDIFRCVYDCGSNQIRMLRADIKKAFNCGEYIDTVFISHFDYDHVNGVEDLLKRCTVGTVVLPYLDDDMTQSVIWTNVAHIDAEDPSSYFNFVLDPVSWLEERGVARVIQLQAGDDDGPGSDTGSAGPDDGDDELEVSDDLFDTRRRVDSVWVKKGRSEKWSLDLQLQNQVNHKRHGHVAQFIKVPGSIKYWALIPYVHPPCKDCLKVFSTKMKNKFGSARNILSQLHDPKVRREIQKTYKDLWPNHNLVSMTLYSGPTNLNTLFELAGNSVISHTHSGGFLLTGDAYLGDGRAAIRNRRNCQRCQRSLVGGNRRDRFLNNYRRCKKLVGALMAPHHGSYKDFSLSLVHFFSNLVVCYASAGTNPYGHPSPCVRYSVHCFTRAFFQTVGNMPGSRLRIIDI